MAVARQVKRVANTDRMLQSTRKPGPSSDIVNENINQGFSKKSKLTLAQRLNQAILKR